MITVDGRHFEPACSTALPVRAKPPCISLPWSTVWWPLSHPVGPGDRSHPCNGSALYSSFGTSVALLHSALLPDERADSGIASGAAKRASLSAPGPPSLRPRLNLGLIIVDEEHDSSYKQGEMPRITPATSPSCEPRSSAPRSFWLGHPSLESWRNAETGNYGLIEMRSGSPIGPCPWSTSWTCASSTRRPGRTASFPVFCWSERRPPSIVESRPLSCSTAGDLPCGAHAALAGKDAMRKLRHRSHPPQAHHAGRDGCGRSSQAGQRLNVTIADSERAEAMSEVRARAPVLPGGRFAAGRRASAGTVSSRPHRPHGPGYRS